MNRIIKKQIDKLGYDFIDKQYIPEGKDEYYLRDEQFRSGKKFRKLRAHEVEVLVKNENTSDNWNQIWVTDKFNPQYVQRCNFYGRVRIGDLEPYLLEYHDLKHPVGLYSSTIVSCDLGDNVAVDQVNHLAYYQIGNECMLLNIDEMITSNHAKFGNGIIKEGEEESVRIWLELCNENGGRRILPFYSMTAGDAYLWTKYRGDPALMRRFVEMVEQQHDNRRGFYGIVGDRTVIKHTRVIKDVKIGSDAYVKGANKLKNLTIDSLPEARTQIGEGCELVNGIISHGCRAFYGVKAVRFYMGSYSNLKYGARLINSYLGNNATISCCEVLNSLIYPGHEQHHNTSFLIAARVEGQSNMAAGATIGSNHNSRANDGELVACRGFWPGLSVSLKHNSRFAAYCLISKGSYNFELDVPLPFTLVFNNESENRLYLMPAYWFMYNVYALARNAWKYEKRDKRVYKRQRIEFDYLAPDTVNQMFRAVSLLEKWVAQAWLQEQGKQAAAQQAASLNRTGRKILLENPDEVNRLIVKASGIENSKREVVITKTADAYQWYRSMIRHYAVRTLLEYFSGNGKITWDLFDNLPSKRPDWHNVGGQLIPREHLDQLIKDVKSASIGTWEELHQRYADLGEQYDSDRLYHACLSLLEITGSSKTELTGQWEALVRESAETMRKLAEATVNSRGKDYENPYRRMIYDSQEEMDAVLGKLEDNDFIRQMQEAAEAYRRMADETLVSS